MLATIAGVWYYMSHREKPIKDGDKIEEINGVSIDLNED
jgi:hypothetical protein